MGSIRIEQMKTRAQNRLLSYLLGLVEIRQFKRATAIDRTRPESKLVRSTVNRPIAPRTSPGGPFVSIHFVNRQTLYLRPDPARVVVRPFKPATEPRDLNPTDKIQGQSYCRAGSSARRRSGRATTERRARQISKAVTGICSISSRRAPQKWKRRSSHIPILNKTQRWLDRCLFSA